LNRSPCHELFDPGFHVVRNMSVEFDDTRQTSSVSRIRTRRTNVNCPPSSSNFEDGDGDDCGRL
jgi:hypothetical protein